MTERILEMKIQKIKLKTQWKAPQPEWITWKADSELEDKVEG